MTVTLIISKYQGNLKMCMKNWNSGFYQKNVIYVCVTALMIESSWTIIGRKKLNIK